MDGLGTLRQAKPLPFTENREEPEIERKNESEGSSAAVASKG